VQAQKGSVSDFVFPLGDVVAVHSVLFQPAYAASSPGSAMVPQFTRQIVFMSGFVDITLTPTLAGTLGNLYVGDLTQGTPPLGLDKPLAVKIAPGRMQALPQSNGVVFVKDGAATDANPPHPYVWIPGMVVPRQIDVDDQHDGDGDFMPDSVRTFPVTTDQSPQTGDEILYTNKNAKALKWKASTGSNPAIDEGSIRAVKIITGGESSLLVDPGATFISAQFSTDGRILGITDATPAPAAKSMTTPVSVTAIRDMPVPTTNQAASAAH
jgi:hypothetical protein